jgi:hypothetical protein
MEAETSVMSIWDWFRGKSKPTGPPPLTPAEIAAFAEQDRLNAEADRRHIAELKQRMAEDREAEKLLAPRDLIKKRLNLPDELPSAYKASESIPVLSSMHPLDDVPMVTVENRAGIGLKIPQVLFDYLYRDRSLTADDKKRITLACMQWGFDPGLA